MSAAADSSSKAPPESNKKRGAVPRARSHSPPSKQAKVEELNAAQDTEQHDDRPNRADRAATESNGGTPPCEKPAAQSSSSGERDSMAAAEALASLRSQDREEPCSSRQALRPAPADPQPERRAHADSSRKGRERAPQRRMIEVEEEDEDDSLRGSFSTASSSDDNDVEEEEEEEEERERDDGECSIVSVQMAPELRRSVAVLAHVQMRLEALEKKGARLHRRVELKLSRQKRPHLDQRATIAQSIPGFWLTALLNHPHLSAHIDESDEDALSYMSNLEVETFKNDRLGYRICFHFRRNPFFQNNVIVKELHLGMGGSPVSLSNPIHWHPGESLTGNNPPRRDARGLYKSFFHWFMDHVNPGKDEIAQILKDDLYKNPLRYYLTPLWEPRENGSTPKPPQNSNGDECVIISDSDEDQEPVSENLEQKHEEHDEGDDDDEGRVTGSDDSDPDALRSSTVEREEEDVEIEELEDSRDSGKGQGQEDEEEIQVDKEEEEN